MRLRWAIPAIFLAAACAAPSVTAAPEADTYSEADFSKVPKFDSHVHANVDNTEFLAIARKDGFELLSINVDYPDFPPLERQAAIARKLYRADPKRFHYAAAFTMKGFGSPGWTERTIRTLDTAFADGAIAVKVWKNIGMVEQDAHGQRVFLDDPRFEPVMARIQQADIPLIAHQGEPRNCWLPLDQMTTANDSSYFREHPEYYMFLHPEEPSYEMLMAARDRFVAFHPKLSVVGAHLASLEWNVDRVAEFLDRFPNATVDMAARMSELQNQSAADYDRVRNFMIKYQDRLIYGTDLTHNPPEPGARAQNPPTSGDDFAQEADYTWRSDWRYLATPLSQHVSAIDADVKGLALPKAVIDKIYRRNARRVLLHER
jgi:predicted TIM-barrel fold metal-dependent hydrolase